MRAAVTRFARALVLGLILPFFVAPATAQGRDRPSAQVSDDEPVGDPAAGLAVIAGAVAVFVLLAWLAVHVSTGADRPADKVPN